MFALLSKMLYQGTWNTDYAMTIASPAAAGSTSADATVLAAPVNLVSGADGTKGVSLPSVKVSGAVIYVLNTNGASALKVYAAPGGKVNEGSADAANSLAASTGRTYVSIAADRWVSVA